MKMIAVFFVCALITGAVWFFLYQLIVHIAKISWVQGSDEMPVSKPRFYCLTGWLMTLLAFAALISTLVQR